MDQAGEFEDFADVAGGVEELEAAGIAFEGDEGADQGADAGAINLEDAGEIDEDIARGGFGEAAKFGAKRVVADADGDAALEIEDGYVAGLARGNLQAHFRLRGARKEDGRRVRIITPQLDEHASYRASEEARNREGNKKGGESQVAFHLPGWVGFIAGSLFGWCFRV